MVPEEQEKIGLSSLRTGPRHREGRQFSKKRAAGRAWERAVVRNRLNLEIKNEVLKGEGGRKKNSFSQKEGEKDTGLWSG